MSEKAESPVTSATKHAIGTRVVYLLAAAFCSAWLLRNAADELKLASLILFWPITCAIPLLLAFAYPRYLFTLSSERRLRCELLINGLGALTTSIIFPVLALPYWSNPVSNIHTDLFLAAPLGLLTLFLVTAVLLLLGKRPRITTVSVVLFWPYWLLFALTYNGRLFHVSTLRAVFCFFCFVAPVLLAFAAGSITYRARLAQLTVVFAALGLPWLYWNLRDSGLGNVWIVFNIPDDGLRMYEPRFYAFLAILTVGSVVLAVATALQRLLPAAWVVRRIPVRHRAWPAVVTCLVVLAVWFSQSVTPYRIPGAVDYFDYPVLRILHVEKHGLQFHETGVRVWRRFNTVGVNETSRHLFQYRFQGQGWSRKLSDSEMQQVESMITASDQRKESDPAEPLRDWNVDAWYFLTEKSGMKVYRADQGSFPPQQLTAFFYQMSGTTRDGEVRTEYRDVCFGFCWDARAAMGFLFANHRCFNNGNGTVCR